MAEGQNGGHRMTSSGGWGNVDDNIKWFDWRVRTCLVLFVDRNTSFWQTLRRRGSEESSLSFQSLHDLVVWVFFSGLACVAVNFKYAGIKDEYLITIFRLMLPCAVLKLSNSFSEMPVGTILSFSLPFVFKIVGTILTLGGLCCYVCFVFFNSKWVGLCEFYKENNIIRCSVAEVRPNRYPHCSHCWPTVRWWREMNCVPLLNLYLT